MMDGDQVFSHSNLFDNGAQDFLFFLAIQLLDVFVQPVEKVSH